MEELNQVESYFVELDDIATNYIESELKNYENIEEYLDKQLLFLDCTRVYPSGLRALQTVDYTYRRNMSEYLYVLNLIDEDLKADYTAKLIERHNANIAYEEEHKPVIYDPKGYKKSRRTSKIKTKSEKVSKPSAKIIKAAAKIKKLGMLKFNIVKNENSV